MNSKEAWTYCSNWNPLFIPQLPLIWEKHRMKTQERDMLDQNVQGDISSEDLQLIFAFVRSVPYHFLKKESFPVSLNYTKMTSVLASLKSIEFSISITKNKFQPKWVFTWIFTDLNLVETYDVQNITYPFSGTVPTYGNSLTEIGTNWAEKITWER